MFRIFFTTWLWMLSANAIAIPDNNPVPGGVAVIPLGIDSRAAPTAKFGSDQLVVTRQSGDWFALVGLSCDLLPGNYIIHAQDPEQDPITVDFSVLPLPPPTIPSSALGYKTNSIYRIPENIRDVPLINSRIKEQFLVSGTIENSIVASFEFETLSESTHLIPYGKIILNGELQTHNYITYLGKPELAVYTPAQSTVISITSDPEVGQTIQLDHGNGLTSVISHLSSIIVETGQSLDKGELIGMSKRIEGVNGSKVDWGLSLNGALINPLQFSSSP